MGFIVLIVIYQCLKCADYSLNLFTNVLYFDRSVGIFKPRSQSWMRLLGMSHKLWRTLACGKTQSSYFPVTMEVWCKQLVELAAIIPSGEAKSLCGKEVGSRLYWRCSSNKYEHSHWTQLLASNALQNYMHCRYNVRWYIICLYMYIALYFTVALWH